MIPSLSDKYILLWRQYFSTTLIVLSLPCVKKKNYYMQTELSLLIIPLSWLQFHASPGTLIWIPKLFVHM